MRGYFFCGDLLGFASIVGNLNGTDLDKKFNSWVSIVKQSAENNGIKKYQLIKYLYSSSSESSESMSLPLTRTDVSVTFLAEGGQGSC